MIEYLDKSTGDALSSMAPDLTFGTGVHGCQTI
jgi:hypothetical protein